MQSETMHQYDFCTVVTVRQQRRTPLRWLAVNMTTTPKLWVKLCNIAANWLWFFSHLPATLQVSLTSYLLDFL